MAYGVLEEQMQPLPTAAVSGLETAAERAPPLLHCLEDGEGLRWRQFRGMIFEKQSQCFLECCHRGGNGRRTEEGSAQCAHFIAGSSSAIYLLPGPRRYETAKVPKVKKIVGRVEGTEGHCCYAKREKDTMQIDLGRAHS